jgi:hypothetical protein
MRLKPKINRRHLKVVDPYAHWNNRTTAVERTSALPPNVTYAANDENVRYRVRNVYDAKPKRFLDLEARMPGSEFGLYNHELRRGPEAAAYTLRKLAKAGHIKIRVSRSGVDTYEIVALATLPGALHITTELLADGFSKRDKIARKIAMRRAKEYMKAHAPSADELPPPTTAPISILISTFDREGHEAAIHELRLHTDPKFKN